MDINLANALFEDGVFSELYQAGFVTDKVFKSREIYLWVHAQMQTRSISKNQAAIEAARKFKKDERTIWRALSCFNETEHELLESFEDDDEFDD